MARALIARLLVVLLLGSCVFPTEKDESVHVSLTPVRILFRGSDTIATAQAWQMTSASDSQPIANAVFVWSSSNPDVATVDGAGRVVGINSGTAIVTAAVANFDKAAKLGADTIRVASPLEIDSVLPKTVHYGEMLTIYGVSVDSIFSASLKGANLIRVPLGETTYANGTVRSRWWVPPPAHTDSLFFLGITGGNGVLGYVHGDTTTVVEQDLYEPNDIVPQLLNLDGPPPFPPLPTIIFANPALAFEPVVRPAVAGVDWYRLEQSGPRDLTVILTAPQVVGTFRTFLADSVVWDTTKKNFVLGPNAWTFGPGSHACHGAAFNVSEAIGDSTIMAFKALPAGTFEAVAVFTVPGRYGLTLIAGYQSEIPPDAHEDDNSCNAADALGPRPDPFRDSLLAIENPHAVDWTLFNSVGGAHQIRLHAFSSGNAQIDAKKDLDLYVIKVPTPGDTTVQVVFADTAPSPDVSKNNLTLPVGAYYAVVVDYAGVSTRYGLCMGPNGGSGKCATAFPASPPIATTRRKSAVRALAPRFVPAPSGP
ncbi:MAG TPA: Ig-like domain-containing protein [Gemmatimonadales bacterium]|nr:Ig-like domain-containing protein [Gemmatimonadales bacterium]